ncbi:hypothetical protein GCM10027187_17820 [Streptosporangium sandarakinum]|uniref:Pierisin-like domain-containing protein n=1 Tax=Streptosporangium sandarakinum TaxID=1260955 RepID=A0A852V388_9ACTN|nr:hypothetical protein [Streptosporangium sandarakinum]NYF42959.1 hypothetical protein [Streptosporangium sandarakinum]
MALQPPAELVALLNLVGLPWPPADEDKLYASGQRWIAFAEAMSRHTVAAGAHVVRTTTRNVSEGVRALDEDWRETSEHSDDAIAAALLIGCALQLAAMIVLAAKVALIVILLRLALNLLRLTAASGPTAGASLAAVPAVVGGSRLATRQLAHKTSGLMERSVLRLFDRATALLRKPPVREGGTRLPASERPPTPVRGPDNYLEAAADDSVVVRDITPYPIWRRDREPLYRVDNRPPEEVFEEGFRPWDPSATDLGDYVNKSAPSAFVGTSYRRDIDNVLLRRHLYEVDAPGGIDVRETLPASGRLGHEQEIAFPGGVHRRYISGAWPGGVPRTPENFIPNPHYDPYPGYPRQ